MLDPRAESSVRVAAELEKPNAIAKLHRIAQWSTHSEADAEDLTQDALARVLDPDDLPWVSSKMSFLTHMSFVMRDTWKNRLRKAMAQELPDAGVTADETTVSDEPPADEELGDRRRLGILRMLGQRLLARIAAKHPIAVAVFNLGALGTDDAQEQATLIQCTVEEVYEAQRTLKRNANVVREEWEEEEKRRIRDLRDKAGTRPTEEDQ
jgi:DNA-directed RNA polymerase specialized sigma24 family protein